jgi:hypothetical protein
MDTATSPALAATTTGQVDQAAATPRAHPPCQGEENNRSHGPWSQRNTPLEGTSRQRAKEAKLAAAKAKEVELMQILHAAMVSCLNFDIFAKKSCSTLKRL